eukprot:392188-Hanusia_phi.AAC.3
MSSGPCSPLMPKEGYPSKNPRLFPPKSAYRRYEDPPQCRTNRRARCHVVLAPPFKTFLNSPPRDRMTSPAFSYNVLGAKTFYSPNSSTRGEGGSARGDFERRGVDRGGGNLVGKRGCAVGWDADGWMGGVPDRLKAFARGDSRNARANCSGYGARRARDKGN